jgi:sialate O-acetylesterase
MRPRRPRRGSSLPLLLAAALLGAPAVATAQTPAPTAGDSTPLRLHRLFGDGMVLQRDAPVPVWGWAAPGTAVAASLGGRTARATADAAGGWRVSLPAMKAGGPHEIVVEGGGRRVAVRDVLVGDVWVASGQSNMEWTVAASTNAAREIAAARDPQLRHFKVPTSWSWSPERDLAGGRWTAADPQHVGEFTAVGYFFARELRASVGVPIGIVNTTWGGSAIEAWLPRDAQGLDDGRWAAVVERERAYQAGLRDSLRARIGADLPTVDAGLVDGRAPWADPSLDDAAWATIPVPGSWEQAGYAGLDGVAWYRTTFTLTAAEAAAGATLSLATIDDADVTWVNGVEVGRTDGYAEPRRYDVPAAALRAGRNVLAIRVTDGGGGGGVVGAAEQVHLEVGGARRPLAGAWKFRVGAVSFGEDGQHVNKIPAVLYHEMLHPLLPFPIRGVIWYQGESNANDDAQATAYRGQFAALIRSWRRAWGQGDLPFLWVQLPNYGPVDTVPPARAAWATIRESQAAALALPKTGQAVAIDLGDPRDIHPRDKRDVGRRLALAARSVAYGQRVVASGPTYRGHRVEGDRVVVELDAPGGLAARAASDAPGAARDGRVAGFAIAGADRRWVWADARIVDGRVVVRSDRVPRPVAVRYAWGNSPRGPGLYDRTGLPAAPFRTDDW